MFAILFALWVFVAHGQTLTQHGDMVEMVADGTNGAQVHLSANTFADQVGDALKRMSLAGHPSRVVDPRVDLRVYKQGEVTHFRLTWSCRIVETTINQADWFFDRRGTLLPGSTPEEAVANVDEEIRTSKKAAQLRSAFPDGRMPTTFVSTSTSGSASDGYWAITEYFIAAPRPK